MRDESRPHAWYKRAGTLILVAIFAAGLGACGPKSQTTKPDESSDTDRGYGGYRY